MIRVSHSWSFLTSLYWIIHSMPELMSFLAGLLLPAIVLSHDSSYRLPNALKPLHYDLRILTHLNAPQNLRFEGTVQIDLQVLQSTRDIVLHATNLTIDETRITLSSRNGSRGHSISRIERNETLEFYTMRLDGELQIHERYVLDIPFSADLNANDVGYYSSAFRDPKTNQTQ